MNPLEELEAHGQSSWLDFLARKSIEQGELKALVENDGVRGVTSNPSIFEKAIGHGGEYDVPLTSLLTGRDRAVTDLYEALAVEDIRNAADVVKPVCDKLDGADGYVSLEVSPYLARDTDGDFDVLTERGRRALRVHIGGDLEKDCRSSTRCCATL